MQALLQRANTSKLRKMSLELHRQYAQENVT